VKVLAVNIRSGGSRATIEAMIARCLSHGPDCIVLSEFRENPVGAQARKMLRESGLAHQAYSSHRGVNGVLLAARHAFSAIYNPFGLSDDEYPDAIIEAIFAELRLFGVYLPGQDRKRPHLRCLISTAQHFNETCVAALCIGDFNSGRNATDIEQNVGRPRLADEFTTADLYAELERYWTEAWLYCNPGRLEFSWYPFRVAAPAQRNGWRIDKAFVSQALLPRLRAARYDHDFRIEKLSDHSALIIELT
jgi:exodeoxyribonuclease III